MTPFLSALLTSLVFFTPTVDSSDLRKCGGMQFPGVEQGQILYALDNEILAWDDVPEAFDRAMETVGIGLLDMTCWDPETGRFGRELVGHYQLVAVTTEPHFDELNDPLMAIAEAQTRFHLATGGYAATIEALGNSDLMVDGLTLSVEDGGWQASLSNDRLSCTTSESPADRFGNPMTRASCKTANVRLSEVLRDYLAAHASGNAPPAGDDR